LNPLAVPDHVELIVDNPETGVAFTVTPEELGAETEVYWYAFALEHVVPPVFPALS
jgi:hypothetical protein